MQRSKVLSVLGLAQKAGQAASGEFAVEKAVKGGLASLVVVAEDASDNTKKRMRNMTDFYHTPLCFYGTKETLGQCIGREYRSMVALLHPGFADSFRKQLDSEKQNN